MRKFCADRSSSRLDSKGAKGKRTPAESLGLRDKLRVHTTKLARRAPAHGLYTMQFLPFPMPRSRARFSGPYRRCHSRAHHRLLAGRLWSIPLYSELRANTPPASRHREDRPGIQKIISNFEHSAGASLSLWCPQKAEKISVNHPYSPVLITAKHELPPARMAIAGLVAG